MRLRQAFFLILFAVVIFAVYGNAQSRTNRLWRPCAASSTEATVEIERDGDINIVPCSGRGLLVNGLTQTITGLSSLNGAVGSAQTFGAPTAADTAAWSTVGTTHTLQLPITSVSGSSRPNYYPYFNAANTLAKSPFSWNTTSYSWNTSTLDSEFIMELTPTTIGGNFKVGDFQVTPTNYLEINSEFSSATLQAADTLNLFSGSMASVGNTAGNVLEIGPNAFTFVTNGVTAVVDFSLYVETFRYFRTITPAGTNGAQTINKPAGSVNFAAGVSSLVVTNNTVDANSIILATARTNDATCSVKSVVPAAGSFTINMTANCTAATAVGFLVTN